MKRRSRAGGKPIKGRRRKTPEPKRRNAPKSPGGSNSSPSGSETEVARLTRDLRDASEQQVATSEVLQVISGSAGDLQPCLRPCWRTRSAFVTLPRYSLETHDPHSWTYLAANGPEVGQGITTRLPRRFGFVSQAEMRAWMNSACP